MIEKENFYTAVDYFDVWGNETDGFEVNDLARIEHDIYIAPDASEQEIKKLARRLFGTKPRIHLNVNWYGDGFIEIEHVSGFPIGRFEEQIS